MEEKEVSIGEMKREISQVVNRVAFGGERIVLTSRGKPKAVIVSLDDYEHIRQAEARPQVAAWEAWRAANEVLSARILAERGGEPLDVDTIWAEHRAELEERDEHLFDD